MINLLVVILHLVMLVSVAVCWGLKQYKHLLPSSTLDQYGYRSYCLLLLHFCLMHSSSGCAHLRSHRPWHLFLTKGPRLQTLHAGHLPTKCNTYFQGVKYMKQGNNSDRKRNKVPSKMLFEALIFLKFLM